MQDKYIFALVPKEKANPFFHSVHEGCKDASLLLKDVECLYVGPDSVDAENQAAIVRKLINSRKVDGISMAVIDEGIAEELAREAANAQIPFITFDSDAPKSVRLAYVGTDNFQFGHSLANVLLKINPKGGVYGIIDTKSPNLALRVQGIRQRLLNTRWKESRASPKDCLNSVSLSIHHMYTFASIVDEPVNAIISVGGWPMRNVSNWKLFIDGYRNLTLDVADADASQLDLISKAYVDGLVGQVPYQMGFMSIQVLREVITGKPVKDQVFMTSLLEIVKIPSSLPLLNVNENRINDLSFLGFMAVAIVYTLAVALVVFTISRRNLRVIKASQPLFLVIILIGVTLMISTIIPFSFEDSNQYSLVSVNNGCMAYPWLLTLGFATAFAALLSKTWRINKIFLSGFRFTRNVVTVSEVLTPVALLLCANILVLSLWTFQAPMRFVRQPHAGTDEWNRVVSTYGVCTSPNGLPYMVTIVFINSGLLVLANYQAYRARNIQSEFSESRYIAIVMGSMLQACIIATPIVFLDYDEPRVVYLVTTLTIFFVCLSILIFIFIPKLLFVKLYSRRPDDLQCN
jgi:7 transmembrane sweet-taste receptor of 3 GCPR/Periplasmic binding protein domain